MLVSFLDFACQTSPFSFVEVSNRGKIDLTESSEKRYNDRKVVENIMINSIEKPIELPIEQKHTGKGNPNAVLTFVLSLIIAKRIYSKSFLSLAAK